MTRLAFAVVVLLASAVADAQIYQWKDATGKTVISDKPPTGNVREQRKIEAQAPVANAAPQKSLADREMEYRKRQQETQEKAEKTKKAESAAADKKDTCERMRRYLETLESGERIAQRDSAGERSIMDDAQRERETTNTRRALQSCK